MQPPLPTASPARPRPGPTSPLGLAVAALLIGALGAACGDADPTEEALENEPPPTGDEADLVVSTRGILVDGAQAIALACRTTAEQPCNAAEEKELYDCLGVHDCHGHLLSLPAGTGDLVNVIRKLPKQDRPLRLSIHRAVNYGLVYEVLDTLAKNGHTNVDLIDLHPRWFRSGGMRYRPPRTNPLEAGTPAVRALITRPGNIALASNVRGAEPAMITVVDDGLNVAGLHHYLAALPEQARGPKSCFVVTASPEIRWATFTRVVALTLEVLPARGYSYRGALEGAFAERIKGEPGPALIGSRLFAAPPPPPAPPEPPPTEDRAKRAARRSGAAPALSPG